MWTTISSSIDFCGKSCHPGVDIAMEFLGLGMGVGTNWLLIWWTDEIGSYNAADCSYYSNVEQYRCSSTRANVLKACEIIGATMILMST